VSKIEVKGLINITNFQDFGDWTYFIQLTGGVYVVGNYFFIKYIYKKRKTKE